MCKVRGSAEIKNGAKLSAAISFLFLSCPSFAYPDDDDIDFCLFLLKKKKGYETLLRLAPSYNVCFAAQIRVDYIHFNTSDYDEVMAKLQPQSRIVVLFSGKATAAQLMAATKRASSITAEAGTRFYKLPIWIGSDGWSNREAVTKGEPLRNTADKESFSYKRRKKEISLRHHGSSSFTEAGSNKSKRRSAIARMMRFLFAIDFPRAAFLFNSSRSPRRQLLYFLEGKDPFVAHGHQAAPSSQRIFTVSLFSHDAT